MEEEESKTHARLMLEAAGYAVSDIPPSKSEKRADLVASLGEETILVEAKSKAPHKEFLALFRELSEKGEAERTREITAYGALSTVVWEASSQLAATPGPDTAVRMIWISCLHDDWRFVFGALRNHVYGEVDLGLFRETGGFPESLGVRRCFYYDYASFKRFPGLDAVMLAGPEGNQILANEFGTRVDGLRGTKLFREMAALNAACDPKALIESGKALAVDGDLPDQKAKWKYILDRYGFKTTEARLKQFSSFVWPAGKPETA